MANSVLVPAGTLGTWHVLVLWLPTICPLRFAVIAHTTSVSNVVEPIWTKIASPGVHPEPDTVSPVPGLPEVGETATVGVAACATPGAMTVIHAAMRITA